MHAMTTAQLSNHSGAEKSKHRAFGHILVIPLVAVAVLAAEAAWVAGAARVRTHLFILLSAGVVQEHQRGASMATAMSDCSHKDFR